MKRFHPTHCLPGLAVAAIAAASLPALADTVAYWRFEEGPAGSNVARGGQPDGVFYGGVADSSGNGNGLSAWSNGSYAGYTYRTDLPGAVIPQTGQANNFSVQNTGGFPALFSGSEAMRNMTPSAFTIEVSFKPENGGYRTLVGRDSRGANTQPGGDLNLAALYLQLIPGNALAIKFNDVSGFWHQAISASDVVTSFAFPDTGAGHWYNAAAVSDGSLLSLYLRDVDAGTGYQLVAQTDLTLSGSPNTALTAGLGSGSDWQAGNWTVGRGLYNGGHGDRAWGFLDEVRIGDSALTPEQFLFVPEPSSLAISALGLAALAGFRRRS